MMSATHTVTITYSSRSATIRLEPRRGARAPWRGDVKEGAPYSCEAARWTTSQFSQMEDGVYEATAHLPEPGPLGC